MDWMNDLDDDGFQVEQYGLPSLVGSGASSHSHSSPSPTTFADAEDSIVSLDDVDGGEDGAGVKGRTAGDGNSKSATGGGGGAPPIVLEATNLDDDVLNNVDDALTPVGSLPPMSMSLPYSCGARQLVSPTPTASNGSTGFVEPLQPQQQQGHHQMARSVGSGGEFAFTFGSSLPVPHHQAHGLPIQSHHTNDGFLNSNSTTSLGGLMGGLAGARSLPSTSLLASLATSPSSAAGGTVFTGAIQGGLRSLTGSGGDATSPMIQVKQELDEAEENQWQSQHPTKSTGSRPKKRARENESSAANGAAGTTAAAATGSKPKPIGKKRSASTSSANVGADLRALSLSSLAPPKEEAASQQGTEATLQEDDGGDRAAADQSMRELSEATSDAAAPSVEGSNAGGEGAADGTSGAPKKKSFKPWNTSPASSHLPSGSACINPVTGEVELPDLQNLTKEEIRKVKNRASAQRSRTRKSEQAVTLREENAKLRHQIEVLTAKIEGREPNPESVNALVAAARLELDHDEEKAAMQNMIQALRDEVMRERHAREMAEHEIARLHAHAEGRPLAAIHHPQTNDALPAMPMSRAPSEDRLVAADELQDGNDDDERMVPIHHYMPPPPMPHIANASSLIRRHKERSSNNSGGAGTVVGRAEGKGVLMMVVLFSFALFSIPPHMRSAGYSTAFHMPISGPTDMNALTRLLPFDDVKVDAPKNKQSTAGTAQKTSASDDNEQANESSSTASAIPRKDAMRGTKSVSFTLLRPISGQADEDTAFAEQGSSSEVESVLEKWLGLSLNEGSSGPSSSSSHKTTDATTTQSDAGWVVLNSPFKEDTPRATIASQPTSSDASSAPLSSRSSVSAWHGGELEPMDLDNELLSISTLFEADTKTHNLNLPFEPDQRRPTFGPSPTLAPHILEDPLNEDQVDHTRDVRSSSVPLFMAAGHETPSTPLPNLRRRQSVSVPTTSTTTGASAERPVAPASSAALMALSRSSAERYMKLEVEMDIEVEFTCKALRRRRHQASLDGNDRLASGSDKRDGMSVVGREEVGRLLKGNVLSIGDGQPGTSLLGLGVGL